jgi:hypothetical protein
VRTATRLVDVMDGGPQVLVLCGGPTAAENPGLERYASQCDGANLSPCRSVDLRSVCGRAGVADHAVMRRTGRSPCWWPCHWWR